jgi:hypothetical protein
MASLIGMSHWITSLFFFKKKSPDKLMIMTFAPTDSLPTLREERSLIQAPSLVPMLITSLVQLSSLSYSSSLLSLCHFNTSI